VFNLLLAWGGIAPQQWLLEPRGVLHLLTGGVVDPSIGPSLALCCIMLFDIWHGCGFMVVVFLAGLSSIPREIEESARIDGAGGLRTTWHITVPLLSPTVFFLAVVGVVRAFQAFNSFYALTQGGGNTQDTRNLILYIYSQFYDYGYWGYATAVSTLLTLAIVALTAVQWRFVGRRVHYS
jgi:ABC-type sugar transport system permease subunit